MAGPLRLALLSADYSMLPCKITIRIRIVCYCVRMNLFFTCLAEISSERTFDEERILIAVSSSKIFPFVKKKKERKKRKINLHLYKKTELFQRGFAVVRIHLL